MPLSKDALARLCVLLTDRLPALKGVDCSPGMAESARRLSELFERAREAAEELITNDDLSLVPEIRLTNLMRGAILIAEGQLDRLTAAQKGIWRMDMVDARIESPSPVIHPTTKRPGTREDFEADFDVLTDDVNLLDELIEGIRDALNS